MNFFAGMGVSATAMSVEQRRMEAAARNLSIVNVTTPPGGTPVVAYHVRVRELGAAVAAQEDPTLQALISGQSAFRGVEAELVASSPSTRLKFEPGHPHADANGYVAYADINYLDEMVSLMEASRSFDANVTAYMEARTMLQKALEIGRV